MPMIDAIATLWLFLSMLGFLFALWALNDTIGDRQWLRDSGRNGPRRIVANGGVRNEWCRLLTMFCFAVAGVATVLRTGLHAISQTLEFTLIYGSLIAGLVLLVIWTIAERRDRQRLTVYDTKRGE